MRNEIPYGYRSRVSQRVVDNLIKLKYLNRMEVSDKEAISIALSRLQGDLRDQNTIVSQLPPRPEDRKH
jgi:hypothetical protein